MNSEERMKVFRFSKDVVAREQALKEEILYLLTVHSNKTQNYMEAIKAVQAWLQQLIAEDYCLREWIRGIAEQAGREFLVKVNQAKMEEKIRKGELPITVKVSQ